jgi:hypothetical protein
MRVGPFLGFGSRSKYWENLYSEFVKMYLINNSNTHKFLQVLREVNFHINMVLRSRAKISLKFFMNKLPQKSDDLL